MSLSLTNRQSFEGKMFAFSTNSDCIFCSVKRNSHNIAYEEENSHNTTYKFNQANFSWLPCKHLNNVLVSAWDF